MPNIEKMQQRLFWVVLIVWVVTLCASAQEKWSLEKDETGIKVYTKTEPGSSYKAFKAEMQVNCNIQDVVEALKNVYNFNQWMTNTNAVKSLKMEDNDQYYYIETSIPWPFDNRDMVYHLQYTKTSNNQVKVIVTGIPDYIQPKEGIVRLEKANGYWILDPIDTSSTVVTYQMHVEPGGAVPARLANFVIVNVPFSIFTELRKMVQK